MWGSHSIVSKEFQDLFHSPSWGSFHRSLTVLCAIGVKKYLVLDRGRPGFTPDFSCLTLLGNQLKVYLLFKYGTITLCGVTSQTLLLNKYNHFETILVVSKLTPQPLNQQRLEPYTDLVWTTPRSLVTTKGISYDFFSSCY